jgi:hypothetical protein
MFHLLSKSVVSDCCVAGVNESESNIISPSMVATLRTPLHSMIASMGSSGSRLGTDLPCVFSVVNPMLNFQFVFSWPDGGRSGRRLVIASFVSLAVSVCDCVAFGWSLCTSAAAVAGPRLQYSPAVTLCRLQLRSES